MKPKKKKNIRPSIARRTSNKLWIKFKNTGVRYELAHAQQLTVSRVNERAVTRIPVNSRNWLVDTTPRRATPFGLGTLKMSAGSRTPPPARRRLGLCRRAYAVYIKRASLWLQVNGGAAGAGRRNARFRRVMDRSKNYFGRALSANWARLKITGLITSGGCYEKWHKFRSDSLRSAPPCRLPPTGPHRRSVEGLISVKWSASLLLLSGDARAHLGAPAPAHWS